MYSIMYMSEHIVKLDRRELHLAASLVVVCATVRT